MATVEQHTNWTTTHAEALLIRAIATRAAALVKNIGGVWRVIDVACLDMDITACHNNGRPLKLAELLAATDADFAHDVFGIARHINRLNGKLRDCFSPRYSQH